MASEYSIFPTEIVGDGMNMIVRAFHHPTNTEKVAKLIQNITMPNVEANFHREVYHVKSLNYLNQPNIVELEWSGIKNDTGIMIFEKMGSDLLDLILANTLSNRQKTIIFNQICKAVEQCHSNNIVHLDLKPENILVSMDGGEIIVKLADFGCSTQVNGNDKLFVFGGTLHYNAPERIEYKLGYDGKKADIWSLGILYHVLLTGMWPLTVSNPEDVRKFVKNGKLQISDNVSKSDKKILVSLLSFNPTHRPSIKKVLKLIKQEDSQSREIKFLRSVSLIFPGRKK